MEMTLSTIFKDFKQNRNKILDSEQEVSELLSHYENINKYSARENEEKALSASEENRYHFIIPASFIHYKNRHNYRDYSYDVNSRLNEFLQSVMAFVFVTLGIYLTDMYHEGIADISSEIISNMGRFSILLTLLFFVQITIIEARISAFIVVTGFYLYFVFNTFYNVDFRNTEIEVIRFVVQQWKYTLPFILFFFVVSSTIRSMLVYIFFSVLFWTGIYYIFQYYGL